MGWGLKSHPFAVEAFFETSIVLTYAVPKEQLLPLIPECLELDTFNDAYGFIAVAMVKTKDLRPKGLPSFMGNDFILTGYRVFVRYNTSAGKRLRGLYILRSETDKRLMNRMGNIFTHYNYSLTDTRIASLENRYVITSAKSDIDVEVRKGDNVSLPVGSPFSNWQEARRYAGPLPFTFTYNTERKEILMIEGVRENWTPQPLQVDTHHVGFIDDLHVDAQLANAFIIEGIPYYWKKGKTDIWKQ